MTRKTLLKTLTLTSVLVASLASGAAAAPLLRPEAAVNGERIRLGDLFEDVGERADDVVAQAPAPGQRAVFDANYLSRVAQTHRIAWRPASLDDRAVITRASRTIGSLEIEAALLPALSAKLPAGRLRLELDGLIPTVHLPIGTAPEVTVESLSYVPTGSRFTAALVVSGKTGTPTRLVVSGKATSHVEVPVLTRRIAANEVIGKSDVAWVETRADQAADLVLSESELVGQAPRRPIAPQTPIRSRDLQAPRIISKGALVTMVLKTPNLTLTAQGRALQEGAVGDVIRVSNTQSNRVIEATVAAAGLVTIARNDVVLN